MVSCFVSLPKNKIVTLPVKDYLKVNTAPFCLIYHDLPCFKYSVMPSHFISKHLFQNVNDVILVLLLLTLNIFAPFSIVSVVDFEQVNVSWETNKRRENK